MSNQVIIEDLPELYRKFLPAFFTCEVPQETFATCNNCAMVCKDKARTPQLTMKPFDADKKCCTFYPNIPNYLVGSLLSDNDPILNEGRKRMKSIIINKIGVLPMGVFAPKKYNLLVKHGGWLGFGKSESLLCPYFERDSKLCTIWKYREAVCSTYFCKSVSNTKGMAFHSSMTGYLLHIQECIAKYILCEVSFDSEAIVGQFQMNNQNPTQLLTTEEMDEVAPTKENYHQLWEKWDGKEEMLYIKAYELAQGLTRDKFLSICGIQEKILRNTLATKRKKIVNIPETLKLNDAEKHKLANETFEVQLKKIDTAFQMPTTVFKFFDGSKPWKEVCNLLREKEDIDLDEHIVQTLYHFGILIAAKT